MRALSRLSRLRAEHRGGYELASREDLEARRGPRVAHLAARADAPRRARASAGRWAPDADVGGAPHRRHQRDVRRCRRAATARCRRKIGPRVRRCWASGTCRTRAGSRRSRRSRSAARTATSCAAAKSRTTIARPTRGTSSGRARYRRKGHVCSMQAIGSEFSRGKLRLFETRCPELMNPTRRAYTAFGPGCRRRRQHVHTGLAKLLDHLCPRSLRTQETNALAPRRRLSRLAARLSPRRAALRRRPTTSRSHVRTPRRARSPTRPSSTASSTCSRSTFRRTRTAR